MKTIILKHQGIGSGKIKRRMLFSLDFSFRKKRERLTREELGNFSERLERKHIIDAKKPKKKKNRDMDKSLDFLNVNNKFVFDYWNKKGYPFSKHLAKMSFIAVRSISQIDKAIKKYGKDEVIKAINLCHDLFTNPNFMFIHHKAGIYKISLATFVKYSTSDLSFIENTNKKLYNLGVKSWMKECMKGKNYLNKFLFDLKPKNQAVYEEALDIWKDFKQINFALSGRENHNIILFSNKILQFCKINDMKPKEFLYIYNRHLNEWGEKPIIAHTGYLITPFYWNVKIPNILVKYGSYKSINEINLMTWK